MGSSVFSTITNWIPFLLAVAGFLVVWWLSTASRRKLFAAQTEMVAENIRYMKRTSEHLPNSLAETKRTNELLTRIAVALEQRASPSN